MITLPAVPLSPGTSRTVQIPISQVGGPVGAFKVSNESPYPLTIGWAGNSQTLAPWTADVFPAPGVQTFTIAVGSGDAFTGAAALVDVAGQGETFTGSYPLSLPGQTSISGGAVEIGTISGPVTVENTPGTTLATQQFQNGPFTLSIPAGTTQNASYTIPPGAGGFSLGVSAPAVNVSVNSQGEDLLSISNPTGLKTYLLPLPQFGTQLNVQGTAPAANSVQLSTVFLPPGVAVGVYNTSDNPLSIAPDPWLVPTALATGFGAAGGTILPALVAPRVYRIHQVQVLITTAGSFNIAASGVGNLVQGAGSVGELFTIDHKGMALPVGCVVTSNGGGQANWSVDYATDIAR